MNDQLYIGCSGFSERLWKGFFYPEELSSREYLQYYSAHLNSTEINSTFYRRPRAGTLQKWRDETPDDFRFFIKVHKYFTHTKRLKDCGEELTMFCAYIAEHLQEKLAGFLFQMPPSFKNNQENLERVISLPVKKYLNVFEFRDESWWSGHVFEALAQNQLVFSGVSFPKKISDEVIVNSITNVYYRLHGVPQLFKSEYSVEFLQRLAEQMRQIKGNRFIYFNNTFGIGGIKNALYLKKILE